MEIQKDVKKAIGKVKRTANSTGKKVKKGTDSMVRKIKRTI